MSVNKHKDIRNLKISATFICIISTRVENVPYCSIFFTTNQTILQQSLYYIKYIYIFTNAQIVGSNIGFLHNVIIYKSLNISSPQLCLEGNTMDLSIFYTYHFSLLISNIWRHRDHSFLCIPHQQSNQNLCFLLIWCGRYLPPRFVTNNLVRFRRHQPLLFSGQGPCYYNDERNR